MWGGVWGGTLFLTFSCQSKRTHDYKSISFNQKRNTDCPTKWTNRLNLLLFAEFTQLFQLNDKRLVFKTEKYLDTFLDFVNSRWPFCNSIAIFDRLSLSHFCLKKDFLIFIIFFFVDLITIKQTIVRLKGCHQRFENSKIKTEANYTVW